MVMTIELWTEAAGALFIAMLLPFYMGYVHLSLFQLLLYVAVTAPILVAGDYLRFGGIKALRLSDVTSDMMLWGQMVLGLGLPSYLLALLAV